MLASASASMDIGRILLDLTIILLVAKLAAEISDRIHVPAVIGEIFAGILIGPSVLGLVNTGDMLFFLAELGVIMLLIQVGLETDIVELKSVGRASILVAIIGVVLPMALGFGASSMLGESINTSLFIGAALTATSIGITARVFGDLRALATVEARTVLGAAVVDDVLGLIILTVVTRIVEQGSVGIGTVASTIGLAIGFLAVTSTVGFTIFPQLFARITKIGRSASTVSVVAIGIALGFSVLADQAHLAPIIGAFVAGLALRRIAAHERVERDVTSIAQIFVPIFFLNIGISTNIRAMADARVIGVALILSVLAIIGKIAAATGAIGSRGDKWTIGFGMLPRGEVGLIFASIGLSVGALSEELYGSVLVVVLVTTLVAPPLLRWRLGQQAEAIEDPNALAIRPLEGWVKTIDGQIVLNGSPPVRSLVEIGLATASLAVDARPSGVLLDWFALHRNATLSWNDDATIGLLGVLRHGSARAWRLLETIGFIQRALPEVSDAMAARSSDSTELDPTHSLQFPTVEAICFSTSAHASTDELVLAAFAKDISDSGADGPGAIARLGLDLATSKSVLTILDGAQLLRNIVQSEPLQITPRLLTQIANHLKNPLTVEQCRQLVSARQDLSATQNLALLGVVADVQEVLAHPDLVDSESNTLVDSRIRAALDLTSDDAVRTRISHAPASYALTHTPKQLLDHALLVEPMPRTGDARIVVLPTQKNDQWLINIACRDRSALLARLSGALSSLDLNVLNAEIATWADGAVLDIFTVQSTVEPRLGAVSDAVQRSLQARSAKTSGGPFGLNVQLDHSAHPWHSIMRVGGEDHTGLLRDITATLAKLKVVIHHAQIGTDQGRVHNMFEISDAHGRKLSEQASDKIIRALQ
ncbi:MAG: ACT domain-containing protein [Actinobacteria bacterium]|nr:MAG: ACT domain-containing protein [Actinomycetota bacterium]